MLCHSFSDLGYVVIFTKYNISIHPLERYLNVFDGSLGGRSPLVIFSVVLVAQNQRHVAETHIHTTIAINSNIGHST